MRRIPRLQGRGGYSSNFRDAGAACRRCTPAHPLSTGSTALSTMYPSLLYRRGTEHRTARHHTRTHNKQGSRRVLVRRFMQGAPKLSPYNKVSTLTVLLTDFLASNCSCWLATSVPYGALSRTYLWVAAADVPAGADPCSSRLRCMYCIPYWTVFCIRYRILIYAAVWSMPLCRVLWFVLNKLLSQRYRTVPSGCAGSSPGFGTEFRRRRPTLLDQLAEYHSYDPGEWSSNRTGGGKCSSELQGLPST